MPKREAGMTMGERIVVEVRGNDNGSRTRSTQLGGVAKRTLCCLTQHLLSPQKWLKLTGFSAFCQPFPEFLPKSSQAVTGCFAIRAESLLGHRLYELRAGEQTQPSLGDVGKGRLTLTFHGPEIVDC